MIKAKALNIRSQTTVPYDSSLSGISYNHSESRYIHYDDGTYQGRYIGGADDTSYLVANSFIIQGLISHKTLNVAEFSFSVPIIMLTYIWQSPNWVTDGGYILVSKITTGVTGTVGSAYVDYQQPGGSTYQSIELGQYKRRNSTAAVSISASKIKLDHGYAEVNVYTQDELNDYADDNFSQYASLVAEIKQLQHGGVVCRADNLFAYSTTASPNTIMQSDTGTARIHPELLAKTYGVARTNLRPIIIIPFATENECRAAKCAYHQWGQSPYYPIT